jgi:hypothetical protein
MLKLFYKIRKLVIKWGRKDLLRKLRIIIIQLIVSYCFVFSTAFIDGRTINSYEELRESFPMLIGVPIGFVELDGVKIDPPLPYFYGIKCCSSVWHQDKFYFSILIVFLFLILLYLVYYFVSSKRKR